MKLFKLNHAIHDDGKTFTQIIAVLAVSFAVFVAGCHGGWPGPSLRKILSDEYPFDVTSEEASYIAIIGPVGDVIGGVLGSTLIDIIGRKWTILSIFIPQCLSHITLYFSYYYKELLYCGRIFGGIGEGATLSVVPVFVAEVAEPKVRETKGKSLEQIQQELKGNKYEDRKLSIPDY
ncbi:facilitated trehalose transporter Tret1-like isoform X2 [Aethina tumida]|uniref:facilitated trehalose transporter Tret1-like isoform X2 n=1 Tax=Aethina tumida TaxID=116153 RepID=UPI0021477FFA|nr:facilitated trehalose transporter Tret1-like isoform X2 [Aethina tumida]